MEAISTKDGKIIVKQKASSPSTRPRNTKSTQKQPPSVSHAYVTDALILRKERSKTHRNVVHKCLCSRNEVPLTKCN